MTAMTAATIDTLSDGRMLSASARAARRSPRAGTACGSASRSSAPASTSTVVRKALARESSSTRARRSTLPLPTARARRSSSRSAGAGRDPDLPRGDRAEQHEARRRDRRRLDPDALLARARRRFARCSRRARRAPAARSTTSGSCRRSTSTSATTTGRARPHAPVHRALHRRHGLARQELLQRDGPRYGFEDAAKKVQDLYLEGKKEEAMAALRDELIDTRLARRPEGERARAAAVFREAGVAHARRHADGVRQGGPARAAAAAGRARRRLSERPGASCSAPSATRATRSRSSRSAPSLRAAATT